MLWFCVGRDARDGIVDGDLCSLSGPKKTYTLKATLAEQLQRRYEAVSDAIW